MPSDPARLAEARADAILARIDAADLDALAAALARLPGSAWLAAPDQAAERNAERRPDQITLVRR